MDLFGLLCKSVTVLYGQLIGCIARRASRWPIADLRTSLARPGRRSAETER